LDAAAMGLALRFIGQKSSGAYRMQTKKERQGFPCRLFAD
jgi:hypothetical protein